MYKFCLDVIVLDLGVNDINYNIFVLRILWDYWIFFFFRFCIYKGFSILKKCVRMLLEKENSFIKEVGCWKRKELLNKRGIKLYI